MNFAGFVCTEAIRVDLIANDKEGVICEMVRALADAGQIPEDHYESVVKAILKREELGSTGMGRGVAVPHTKHPGVVRSIGTVAVSQHGADFGSVDGDRVHVFFLVISPPGLPNEHLAALEHIAQLLRKNAFFRFLTQVKSVEEIKQLLDESDNDQSSKTQ